MAYLDQPQMSNRKLIGLGIAVLVHILLGYALVTGLALEVAKKVFNPIETVNIEEEKPPEEPPPPPEEQQDIPVVAPPPDVSIDVPPPPRAPTVNTNIVAPPPPVAMAPPVVSAPPAPPAPPPAPPAPQLASKAQARGDLKKLITTDDYPSSSLRAEEEGTVLISYVIGTQGRITSCTVMRSSGHPRLDETTCTLATRRFRWKPAQDNAGNPIEDKGTQTVRWQIPKE